jgi:hypothetical protein
MSDRETAVKIRQVADWVVSDVRDADNACEAANKAMGTLGGLGVPDLCSVIVELARRIAGRP